MKFNWGTGILIFIIIFVSGIGTLVYISFQQDINLVHKDYYPREIEHQKMIDKVNNTNQLVGKIKILLSDSMVEVVFPNEFRFGEIDGEILFYRPSDFNEDLAFPIQLSDKGTQHISTDGLLLGKYIIKVEWVFGETEYYFEEAIHVK
jgi:hypothetical protein